MGSTLKKWETGNMAPVLTAVGKSGSAPYTYYVSATDIYQPSGSTTYLANCVDVRTGTPFQGVPVLTSTPLIAPFMGLLFFANGDVSLPMLYPTGTTPYTLHVTVTSVSGGECDVTDTNSNASYSGLTLLATSAPSTPFPGLLWFADGDPKKGMVYPVPV